MRNVRLYRFNGPITMILTLALIVFEVWFLLVPFGWYFEYVAPLIQPPEFRLFIDILFVSVVIVFGYAYGNIALFQYIWGKKPANPSVTDDVVKADKTGNV